MSISAAQNEILPVVTNQASEVYFWGGGKQTPQKQEVFTKGRSAIDISVGKSHIAVVTVEKELYTWACSQGFGSEMVGQLGHGDTAAYKAPKKVAAFESIPIKQVSCGEDFTVCVTDEGMLYAFGSDYYGCLGSDNQEGDEAWTPVQVDFFNDKPVDQVSCGDNHVVALTKVGDVYTWGCGEFGRLGLGSEEDFATPQRVHTRGKHSIKSVHAGADCTFLVKTNGRVLACGSNEHNKLGFNSAAQGLCKRKEQISYDIQCKYTFSTVKPLMKYNILTLSPGQTHTAAINLYGQLLTFGNNKYGQLGVGDYKERSGVSLVSGVLSGQRISQLACGDGFTVLVTSDNQVYSWGWNENGRLGFISDQGKGPNGQCFALPKPIFGSLHRVSSISCHHWHTCMVAEKVFYQKTIRSVSSAQRVCSYVSQESLQESLLDENEAVTKPVSDTTEHSVAERSDVPEWLQQELENDFIPLDSGEKKAVEIKAQTEESVPPWLQRELEEAEFIPASPARCEIVQKPLRTDEDIEEISLEDKEDKEVLFETAAASETARILAKLSQLEFEVASLREENHAFKDSNQKLNDTIRTLTQHNEKLQSQIDQQAEAIRTQAQTVNDLEDKVGDL